MSTATETTQLVGALVIVPLLHPQGCRTYLLADPKSKQALALDVHLDLVEDVAKRVTQEGWTLPYLVDSHTHADHPSGASVLAPRFGSTRIAHEAGNHAGVTRHPADGDVLHLGDQQIRVRHAPGHTADHMVLLTDGALFSGDSLFIGGVARTDFLGGDAGQLFDSVHALLGDLSDDTLVYPGHDYEGRVHSTIGDERANNAWLKIEDRDAFVAALTANPPPRPANMDDLLRLNREGTPIPSTTDARTTIAFVGKGGSGSIIDVRTPVEYAAEHVAGSRLIPLDQVMGRADEVRATPAPRLILCRTGRRAVTAQQSLEPLGIGGLSVVTGGIEAFRAAGGATETGKTVMSLERQVRIGAGLLVLVGVGLGLAVHPAFLGIAAFVGAGQVFAGISDWCGMGLLIAKAPWNRGTPDAGSGPSAGVACAAGAPPTACAAGAPPPAASCAASHLPPTPPTSP